MTPHSKKCPHVVHFNVACDWFERNSRYQKRYSEGGKKKKSGCRGLLGRVGQIKEAANVQRTFFSRQIPMCPFPMCPFWKEPTTEVDLRKACTMVVDSDTVSDPASDLLRC